MPRSPSSVLRRAPSSSAVDSRTVAKRQCSTSSVPLKVPKWVWVLPTSTTRSISGEDAVMRTGEPTLYVVPASHPCAAVMLAFERKGLAYRRVDLPPMVHVAFQRAVFGRRTVPGLQLASGDKVVRSRAGGSSSRPGEGARARGERGASAPAGGGTRRCCPPVRRCARRSRRLRG